MYVKEDVSRGQHSDTWQHRHSNTVSVPVKTFGWGYYQYDWTDRIKETIPSFLVYHEINDQISELEEYWWANNQNVDQRCGVKQVKVRNKTDCESGSSPSVQRSDYYQYLYLSYSCVYVHMHAILYAHTAVYSFSLSSAFFFFLA